MLKSFSIADRLIGPALPCFIIAEAGVNHNGELSAALNLIDAAADAGADAVKFQTFSAERLASKAAGLADYQKRNTGQDIGQAQMLKQLELPENAYPELIARCRMKNILFLSSPFDEEAGDFLHKLDIAAFKIPSGEITNLAYLQHIASFGKPMIVSTGMATMEEIGTALDAIAGAGDPPICLLQCFTDYPAKPSDQNLRVMATLESAFGVPAGFSDHTEGYVVTAAAVALGAHVVEKHFTLDRELPGPDHKASLEPDQLAAMVIAIRDVEAALGDGIKSPRGAELENRVHARKSIVARVDIPQGKLLVESDLAVRRPGSGLSPALLSTLIGRRTRSSIASGTIIDFESLA